MPARPRRFWTSTDPASTRCAPSATHSSKLPPAAFAGGNFNP
ncbi:hypothetical protein BSIN_2142 [Burkholderia singularis]|uniref:Uncharacterized protein n=1 Tax=Burkholderia singularis TaxID=1503053 RepID=A0A238H147_9BURK|nr:hypothetical protein BSIN_2142 [Burkholderia singularis]